jgi:hypothetical protein
MRLQHRAAPTSSQVSGESLVSNKFAYQILSQRPKDMVARADALRRPIRQ